jgi:tripartite ATP-independent transporter DctM subunit
MDPVNAATLILIGGFFALMLLRVPIAFSLGVSTFLCMAYLGLEPMGMMLKMADGIDSPSLLAIPFFILAGQLMADGGIAIKLINLANVFVGFIRGGLAMVNVLASMFFGGISGSSVADTASIGSILIPMMKKKGYDTDFSVGVTIMGSTQGIVIPPSHNVIIYSLAAGGGVSIGKLFLGGVIPGIMIGVSLMVVSYILSVKRNYPRERRLPLREAARVFFDALLGLFTAVIIVGAVIFGFATATESAALAVVYAFVITFFVYRQVSLKRFPAMLTASVKTIAMVMLLIACASAFGFMLSYLGVPDRVAGALAGVTQNRIAMLLLINVMLLALGCIMDMAPLILIVTPVLLPIVTSPAMGLDPVHFGIIMMINLGMGLCTPPVGSTLFVGCAIGKISIEKMARSLWPFYLAMLAVLLLVTFVPEITMWLPNLVVAD